MCLIKMRSSKPIPDDYAMIDVVRGVSTSLPSIDPKAADIDAEKCAVGKRALTRELRTKCR